MLAASVMAVVSCVQTKQETVQPAAEVQLSDIEGQWTIDVAGGGVSWLELRQEQGSAYV